MFAWEVGCLTVKSYRHTGVILYIATFPLTVFKIGMINAIKCLFFPTKNPGTQSILYYMREKNGYTGRWELIFHGIACGCGSVAFSQATSCRIVILMALICKVRGQIFWLGDKRENMRGGTEEGRQGKKHMCLKIRAGSLV